MKKTSQATSIKVFCRLRPLNRLEKEQGGECCVQYTDQAIKVKVAGNDTPYDFGFDGIFGPESRQIDVFKKVAEPVITGLLEGYNGTIFAYGQTSSGKTFTMEGPDVIDSDEALGIIPRMMNYIFNLMMNSSEDIEFNVKVSFLELYNEKVQDLLDTRKNNLQIKEDKTKGIFVQDATEVYVTSAEQMKQVHKSGSENRTQAATRMNERSSRSHSVFVLSVDQKDTKTETTKHSKLYFVDLAGSEKIAKTNVTGAQLEEAKNINKSLSALGLVINALTESSKGHVPYRDSKLTRLLQESLGGNSQTSLILACSMCSYNDKETVDTLRFGNRAKSVKNAPIVNAERSAKELTILLTAAEKKIAEQENFISSLKQQINGGPVDVSQRVNTESAQSNDENKKTDEPESPAEASMAKKSSASSSGAGANSLFLLKNQIELANVKEELQEAKATTKELETEVNAKNKEIYELNGKILQYESQLAELANKNTFNVEEYQVQFEKLYHENQEKAMLASKFKRAIHRLKADLNFTYLSKHLMALEGGEHGNKPIQPDNGDNQLEAENNKDELIANSIKKTIETLEEIEKEIDQSNNAAQSEEISNIIDSLMKNSSPTLSTAKSDTNTLFNNDTLLTENNDISKENNLMLENCIDSNKDSDTQSQSSKVDGENNDDFEKSQFMSLPEEEKVTKLQSLIASQRKTINSLTKSNNELTHTNQKYISAHQEAINNYKVKAEEWHKTLKEKTQESDQKIHNLKIALEAKLKEIEDGKKSTEKQFFDRDGQIADLRDQVDKLQSLLSGNEDAIKNYELDRTVKMYIAERKRLAEELMTLRKEVDEKDDLLNQKTGQIEILQNNISLAAKEIKALKAKPAVAEIPASSSKSSSNSKSSSSKKNNQFVLFDKHVVKPIRGGGGDASAFAKNNQLLFDKPSKPAAESQAKDNKESVKIPEAPKTTRGSFLNFNLGLNFGGNDESKATKPKEEPKSSRTTKDNDSFKKFDELLQKKGDSGKKQKPIENLRVSTEADEDDGDDEAMKNRYKLLGKETGGKQLKKLFSGVKNLFS